MSDWLQKLIINKSCESYWNKIKVFCNSDNLLVLKELTGRDVVGEKSYQWIHVIDKTDERRTENLLRNSYADLTHKLKKTEIQNTDFVIILFLPGSFSSSCQSHCHKNYLRLLTYNVVGMSLGST